MRRAPRAEVPAALAEPDAARAGVALVRKRGERGAIPHAAAQVEAVTSGAPWRVAVEDAPWRVAVEGAAPSHAAVLGEPEAPAGALRHGPVELVVPDERSLEPAPGAALQNADFPELADLEAVRAALALAR